MIAIVESLRPTDAEVKAMWDANNHGGGVAWREDGPNGPVVKWKKGLDEEEMVAINRTLPFPYVMHFRIASSDTSKSMLACHPFPVDPNTPSEFEGEQDGYVLFHNGYWTGWKDRILDLAARHTDIQLPSGPWSDSRGLAWYSSLMGFGVLEVINEKVVCLGPEEIEIFGGWNYYKPDQGKKEGYLVSNLGWQAKIIKPYNVSSEKSGGASQQHYFPAQQQAAEGTQAGVGAATPGTGGPAHVQPLPAESGKDHEQGVQAATQGTISTIRAKCHFCHQVKRGSNNGDNHFTCWQCWSAATANGTKMKCGLCKVTETQLIRTADNLPICWACNDVNGRMATCIRALVSPASAGQQPTLH